MSKRDRLRAEILQAAISYGKPFTRAELMEQVRTHDIAEGKESELISLKARGFEDFSENTLEAALRELRDDHLLDYKERKYAVSMSRLIEALEYIMDCVFTRREASDLRHAFNIIGERHTRLIMRGWTNQIRSHDDLIHASASGFGQLMAAGTEWDKEMQRARNNLIILRAYGTLSRVLTPKLRKLADKTSDQKTEQK